QTAVLDQNLNATWLVTAKEDLITEGTESIRGEISYLDKYFTITINDTSLSPVTMPSQSEPSVVINANNNVVTIGNSVVNGRDFLSDEVDSLTGQANFNKALMGGDDYLEVVGGSNNFANGNRGADYFVIRGGEGRYLGGRDDDTIKVIDAVTGSWVNGNQGSDFISGGVAGVTYRGGADNDLLAVSAGNVSGDKGADTFQAIAGEGVAIVQDYTAGEDLLKGIAGGSFTLTEQGLSYGVGGDQMLLLAGITDASQVTLI
ncbi:hypothetical protein N9T01_00525, partial [bacterium]|nr:hypothetical protein [bacterium]